MGYSQYEHPSPSPARRATSPSPCDLPLFRHHLQSFSLHPPEVAEYGLSLADRYATQPNHPGENAVVHACRTARACAPLGTHGLEDFEGVPVVRPDADLRDVVVRGEAEGIRAL